MEHSELEEILEELDALDQLVADLELEVREEVEKMVMIKMVASVTGIAGASSAIDVPNDGTIEALVLGVAMQQNDSPADNDWCGAELSFLSTAQLSGGHDSRGSLGEVAVWLIKDGALAPIMASTPFYIQTTVEIPVAAGERIFLHIDANQADITAGAIAYLWIREKASARTLPRRR